MEIRTDFLCWLSTKLYVINVGFYATVGLIMLLPHSIVYIVAIPAFAASLMAFFVVLFLRTIYETMVVYEVSFKRLSFGSMLIFSVIMSVVLALVSYFLKPMIGFFSIPVSIMLSTMLVGKCKAVLFVVKPRPGFFVELPAKLKIDVLARYGFFAFLVGGTYFVCQRCGMDLFIYAFAVSFFIGMLFEETFLMLKLYDQDFTVKSAIGLTVWTITCALVSTAIVAVMLKYAGCSGAAATITSVIVIKLIQPLGSRKFIIGM